MAAARRRDLDTGGAGQYQFADDRNTTGIELRGLVGSTGDIMRVEDNPTDDTVRWRANLKGVHIANVPLSAPVDAELLNFEMTF